MPLILGPYQIWAGHLSRCCLQTKSLNTPLFVYKFCVTVDSRQRLGLHNVNRHSGNLSLLCDSKYHLVSLQDGIEVAGRLTSASVAEAEGGCVQPRTARQIQQLASCTKSSVNDSEYRRLERPTSDITGRRCADCQLIRPKTLIR